MNKLYEFKRNGPWVKFYNWLWDVNPSNTYKVVCPYFWKYVGSILFLVPLVIFRIVVNTFNSVDDKIKENRELKIIARLNDVDTPLKAYLVYCDGILNHIVRFKISEEQLVKILNLLDEHLLKLREIKIDIKEKEPINYTKYPMLSGFIGGLILSVGVFYLYKLLVLIIRGVYTNWDKFLNFFIFLGIIILILIVIACLIIALCFISDLIKGYLTRKNIKINLKGSKLGRTCINFFNIFYIIFDMVKALYKKYCPIITWVD